MAAFGGLRETGPHPCPPPLTRGRGILVFMTNARSGFLPVDNARRGIVMMVAATALWTIGDAGSKWLAERYPVFQILFMRNVFAFVPILWLGPRHGGWPALRPSRAPAPRG